MDTLDYDSVDEFILGWQLATCWLGCPRLWCCLTSPGTSLECRSVIYLWPCFWATLLFFNVFSFNFNWLLLICLEMAFACANLAGYWKCSNDAKKRAREWVEQHGVRAVMSGLICQHLLPERCHFNSTSGSLCLALFFRVGIPSAGMGF